MPVFTNPIAQRCARWILLTTSPAPLPIAHPARDDFAAAADEIERLKEALEASQELLVTSLHYRDNEYVEDTYKQAAINRGLLGPATSPLSLRERVTPGR